MEDLESKEKDDVSQDGRGEYSQETATKFFDEELIAATALTQELSCF